MMKKALVTILVVCLVLIACGEVARAHVYTKAMLVVAIDQEQDLITCLDAQGDEWQFYGVDEWQINDVCVCLMYDSFTQSIYDDVIISTHYGD